MGLITATAPRDEDTSERAGAPASESYVSRTYPTRHDAEKAVETLIRWAGDDPSREGLSDTPRRVVNAFEEWFSGYAIDPKDVLARTFEEVGGYDDIVLLKDIPFVSHCEHHMAAIIGRAAIAYLPDQRVVGISKLARVTELYARRLQTQETMTAQIADAIDEILQPKGVAIHITAEHQCMSTRGVNTHDTDMITTRFTGAFQADDKLQNRFLRLIGK